MECLIAIGSSILGKLAEYAVEPVGRQLGYLFCYRSNIDNLRNKVQELDNRRTSLMHQVEVARRNGEEIEADVQDWLYKSKDQFDEASRFLANEDQIGMQSSMVSRYKSSKKAKKTKDVVNKTQEGGKFSKVSHSPILPNLVENKGYEAFETRMSIENEIMEALKDSSVCAIGVYGIPGAGKTMLAKEIARKTKNEGLFLEVATVVVSQTPDVIKIQEEIAEQLGLTFVEKTQRKRADRLRDRLRKEHKLLIVLDDIWDELELGNVGIHFEDDQKGCKLLFTSRFEDVLLDHMGVDKNFCIEPLPSSEAMNLFKKMVGESAEKDDLKPLADDVVEECGGLPIAIVTVAKALKNQGLPFWSDALTQLKNSSRTNIDGMLKKVYSSVKLSYDSLTSEEKSLLLLCSLHEEDERIDRENLMRYGVGWGLFRDVDTLDAARNRVKTVLDKLTARCLLLDGSYEHEDKNTRVMMHDVIRDVGIYIASEEERMVNFKAANKLEECSSNGELKESIAIFLSERNVDNHIEKLECPELKLFLSPESTFLVPDHFFEETKKLRALDLSCGNLESLSSSSFVLRNLVTLCLSRCKLGDVTFIGELKKLEILDLSWSNVAKLPRQYEKLTRLRLLDLRHCRDLKVIEAGVISKLTGLEELYMEPGFTQWEVEGVGEDENVKNEARLIPEVKFPRLRRLSLERLPKLVQLFWSHLEIGTSVSSMLDCPMMPLFSEKVLFPNLIDLTLRELNIRKLWPDQLPTISSSIQNCRILSMLTIENCPKLSTTLDTNSTKKDEQEGMSSVATQPLLQEKRCGTLLPSFSFNNLKTLKVSECPKVICLLVSSTARSLVHLSTMSIIGCKQLTEIITMSEEDKTKSEIVFKKLKSLVLDDLRSLRSFYSSNTSITFPELEKLILCGCPELRSFSHGTINSSKLTSIFTQTYYEENENQWPLSYFEEYEEAKPKELVWDGDINTTVLNLWEKDQITSIRHLFKETESI